MIQSSIDGFEVYEFHPKNKTNEEQPIFFAHANGIPAQTYKSLFEKMSLELNCSIYTYDIRGFGKTNLTSESINQKSLSWAWEELAEDHCNLFFKIQSKKPKETKWILCGHSLGAWISLMASKKLAFHKLILLDPPILKPNIIIPWFVLHLLNKKHLSPMSKKVKRRKIQFSSRESAFYELKKSRLMKEWPEENIRDYIEGSFKELNQNNEIVLRHSPNWEGFLFEEYPRAAWFGFLKIPKKIRNKIEPIFIVGENSDTCNPNSKDWIKFFFPKLKWILLPNGGHMFPIEKQYETIALFKNTESFLKI